MEIDKRLHKWHNDGVWDSLIEQVRTTKASEHRQAYSRLVDKSLAKAEAGIDQLGDDLSAADIKALVITGAASTDKIRLADNQPTSITQRGDSMTELKEQFRRLSSSYTLVPKSTIIEQDDNEAP